MKLTFLKEFKGLSLNTSFTRDEMGVGQDFFFFFFVIKHAKHQIHSDVKRNLCNHQEPKRAIPYLLEESRQIFTGVKGLLHNGVSCGARVPVIDNGEMLHHIAHVPIHLAVAQVPRHPPEEPILVQVCIYVLVVGLGHLWRISKNLHL